ncbi:MAG TPA: ROK family protein [Clostridia bacterium]|nr:ROK family protein [Clostridia bacterium]
MLPERFAVALDVGGTFIKGALIQENGLILERLTLPTERSQGYRATISKIKSMIETLKGYIPRGVPCAGVGLGIAGWTDPVEGMVRLAPNLGWRDKRLLEEFKDVTVAPILLDNDANLAALGELWLGAGRKQENFLLLTIGTGIGSGLILEGKLYRGFSGSGPEAGHMTVDPGGLACSCGRNGCLETLVSAPAILQMVRELPGVGWWSDPHLQVKEVFLQAEKEEPLARGVVEKVTAYLACGLANLALILDLPLVIIGGGVGQAGQVLLGPLRKYLNEELSGLPQKVPEIRSASLGNEAGLLGGASLVFQSYPGAKPPDSSRITLAPE